MCAECGRIFKAKEEIEWGPLDGIVKPFCDRCAVKCTDQHSGASICTSTKSNAHANLKKKGIAWAADRLNGLPQN